MGMSVTNLLFIILVYTLVFCCAVFLVMSKLGEVVGILLML